MLLFDTGMRLSECAGLTLADVDLAAGELVVLGKGRKARELSFGAAAARRSAVTSAFGVRILTLPGPSFGSALVGL